MHTEMMTSSVSDRAKIKLERDLGPLILEALADPTTVELMLNPDGTLWHERLGSKGEQIGEVPRARAEAIIKTISGFHGKEITRFKPILECELPLDGSRFTGQLPPIVQGPSFTIRKKAISVFSLDDYVGRQIMTVNQSMAIKRFISEHKNILVIGGTGSGKTTLVNAIIAEMVHQAPHERVVIIEDTGEIQCMAKNNVQYHTTTEIDMTQLLKTTLRMRPDRILVGEVRDGCALDLLDAWNTGHEGGAATLHANNSLSGLTRLKSLISRNPCAPKEIEPLISEVVHVVVHIESTFIGRCVRDVMLVKGFENGEYITETLN